MRATVVPVIAQALGVDPKEVDAEFSQLQDGVREARGVYDSRTFALAVQALRQSRPFALEDLSPARRALGEIGAQYPRPAEATR